MKNINEVILDLIFFFKDENDYNHLFDFLNCSMDEARLIAQHKLSLAILRGVDMDDLEYFRQSLTKREIKAIISYDKQRDHSAHTLNNYLLGVLIYQKTNIKDHFKVHFKTRKIESKFESLWPFVSLLHDIGYIFEGSISKLDVTSQSDLIKIGALLVNDYFSKFFWLECGIASTHSQNRLKELINNLCYSVDSTNIHSISASLLNTSNLNILITDINRYLAKLKLPTIKHDLSTDIFDLWISNAEYFRSIWNDSMPNNSPSMINPYDVMIKRIILLKRYYYDVQVKGYKKIKVKSIDHAIASGLILMLASTYYFILRSSFSTRKAFHSNYSKYVSEFIEYEKIRARNNSFIYNPEWWWSGVCWATFSTAFHNFPQMKKFWPEEYDLPVLSPEEDPLTYLGILVDIIQVWDRYSVDNESLYDFEYPIQSKDVKISFNEKDRIINIYFPDKKLVKNLKEELSSVLLNWSAFIKIKYRKNPSYSNKFVVKKNRQIMKLLS